MSGSNYKKGISVFGVPVLPEVAGNIHTGNVFFVDSGNVDGSDTPSAGKKIDKPFVTLDYAIGKCTANNGDLIIVLPGHAETVASASAITHDVAGITVHFLGKGADRPTFTFSDTASTIVVSAASTKWVGYPILKPSVDSVVSPLVIQAADCSFDIEIQDASDTVEFVRAILTDASADRLAINIRYVGRTGGNACVNAVRLVGSNGVRIWIDFYGKASTSIVEFETTLCTDVDIRGYVYNSGTTDGSKNVVDTAGSSTWYSDLIDGAAGARYTGGSGAAVASDDVSSVISALHGTAGIASFPAAAAAANNVSIAEVVRYISELQVPRIALKSSGDLTAFGTSLALFTVTGDVLCRVAASVDVAVTSTSGTTTLEVGIAGNTAALCVQDAVDNTAFAVGDSWSLITAADNNGAQLADEWLLVGDGADITLVGSVDDITAGDIDFYCQYIPLTSGSSVVAA